MGFLDLALSLGLVSAAAFFLGHRFYRWLRPRRGAPLSGACSAGCARRSAP